MGLLFAVSVWLFASRDGPVPDDSALLPHWSDREGDTNPLAVFCHELEAQPMHDDFDRLPSNVRMCVRGTENQVREFFKSHESSFEAFDKLMATDTARWRWPGGPRISDFDFYIGYLTPASDLGLAQRMKVRLLCMEGKYEDAVRLAMNMIRYGRGLEHAEGGMIHMLVAITMDANGHDALKQAVAGPSVRTEVIRSCLSDLRRLGGLQREDYQFVLCADYLCCKRTIERVKSGAIGSSSLSGQQNLPRVMRCSPFFKPNRTLATRIELSRPMLEGLDQSWTAGLRSAKAATSRAHELFIKRPDDVSFYLSGNIAGNIINNLMWMPNDKMMEKSLTMAILHDEAEAMLALRLFELKYRTLPENLTKLAPELLARVPDDHFSGHPMLWNPASRVLYSVGTDQKDDGGSVNDERPSKGADLGMHYWWSQPSSDEQSK